MMSQESMNQNSSQKPSSGQSGFVHESEEARLLRDIYRSDLEKLQLFTRMIRRNRMFKKAGF